MSPEELAAKVPEVEDAARQLGLYLEEANVAIMENGAPVLIGDFSLGAVAFSDRVQHPENFSVDKEFQHMQIGMARDEFLDERQRVLEAIRRGEDPFAS